SSSHLASLSTTCICTLGLLDLLKPCNLLVELAGLGYLDQGLQPFGLNGFLGQGCPGLGHHERPIRLLNLPLYGHRGSWLGFRRWHKLNLPGCVGSSGAHLETDARVQFVEQLVKGGLQLLDPGLPCCPASKALSGMMVGADIVLVPAHHLANFLHVAEG